MAESLALEVSPRHHPLPHAQFSDREFQIFRMIVAGKTITEIADELMVSVKTVSTYKARVLEKTRLANVVELIQELQTARGTFAPTCNSPPPCLNE